MRRVTREIRVESGRELRSPWSEHEGSTLLRQSYSLTLPSFVTVIPSLTQFGCLGWEDKGAHPLPQGVHI